MKIAQYTLIALIAFAPSSAWAAAKIKVKPNTDHPKATIGVSGSGFDANESIGVYWDDKKLLFTVNSDGSGNFAKQKTKVPKSAPPGAHTIDAKGADGDSARASFTVTTPWANFGFAPTGGRNNAYENVISSKNVSGLSQVWAVGNSYAYFSPVVANGTVYVAADVKNVTYTEAFDAATGTLLWSTRGGGSQAVANGVVYAGAGSTVQAMDATTGELLWTANVEGDNLTVAGGVVYDSTFYPETLYALDAATGNVLWSAATGNYTFSFPAVANGIVYVGSYDHNLYAFDATTGATLWTAATGNVIASSPAVANGIVYVGSADHKLYAFDATTGALVWSAATGNEIFFSSPAVANGVVYIGSEDDKLYAFDAATGHLQWSAATGGGILTSPAVANGIVYIGARDNTLYAFDATTGATLWSQTVSSGFVWADPVVSDGTVYDGGQSGSSGTLYAFALGGDDAAYKGRHALRLPYAPQHPDLH